jgi:trimethylamine:corrinoid methyltransferase-like protein
LELLAICNEIINWIKVYMKPLVINDETIAMGDIRTVVEQDSDFLSSDNTLKHFREDLYPRLLDRRNHDEWEADGSTTLRQRANKYVEELLNQPEKQYLTEEQLAAVQAVVDRD